MTMNQTFCLFETASRSGTHTSEWQINDDHRGVTLFLAVYQPGYNVDDHLRLTVEAGNPYDGKETTLLDLAAFKPDEKGQRVFVIYPGAQNYGARDVYVVPVPLPSGWRVRVETAEEWTYSLSGCYQV